LNLPFAYRVAKVVHRRLEKLALVDLGAKLVWSEMRQDFAKVFPMFFR
jgi:hypothetical protein